MALDASSCQPTRQPAKVSTTLQLAAGGGGLQAPLAGGVRLLLCRTTIESKMLPIQQAAFPQLQVDRQAGSGGFNRHLPERSGFCFLSVALQPEYTSVMTLAGRPAAGGGGPQAPSVGGRNFWLLSEALWSTCDGGTQLQLVACCIRRSRANWQWPSSRCLGPAAANSQCSCQFQRIVSIRTLN